MFYLDLSPLRKICAPPTDTIVCRIVDLINPSAPSQYYSLKGEFLSGLIFRIFDGEEFRYFTSVFFVVLGNFCRSCHSNLRKTPVRTFNVQIGEKSCSSDGSCKQHDLFTFERWSDFFLCFWKIFDENSQKEFSRISNQTSLW
jgi:hypothetical protein